LGSSHITKDVLYEPLASHHELFNNTSPPRPQLWDYVFPHIFSPGCESTVLGSHSPFNLVEEIPLELSTASDRHAVCTAYAGNSSSFTLRHSTTGANTVL